MMGLSTRDIIVLGFLLILAIVPDPTDALDFFSPVLEIILMAVYWFVSKRKILSKGD